MDEAGSAFEAAIRIEYRPSARIAALLTLAHIGALAAIALSGVPAAWKLAAAVLAAASLFGHATQWLRQYRDPAPPVLLLNNRDEWRIRRAGRVDPMTSGTECVALPWLVILHLHDEARASRFFILTTDNTSRDDLRRLCVRLRFPIVRAT